MNCKTLTDQLGSPIYLVDAVTPPTVTSVVLVGTGVVPLEGVDPSAGVARLLAPQDAATNPSLLYQAQMPVYRRLLHEAAGCRAPSTGES